MSDILAALAKALPLVEGAIKDANNPHFKSKYADLGSVIAAIRPVAKEGLWFRQAMKEHDKGALVETFYIHASGELSAGDTFVPADRGNAQGFGSAMTYARRYGLMAAFGIAPEDDDGNAAASSPPKQRAELEGDAGYIGPKGGKMALKKRADTFYRDLLGCGDQDMLAALLNSDEAQDLKGQLEQEWIGYLNGEGMTEDFEPINRLVRRLKAELPEVGAAREQTVLEAG